MTLIHAFLILASLAFLAASILALSCARTGRSDTDGEAQDRMSDDGGPEYLGRWPFTDEPNATHKTEE